MSARPEFFLSPFLTLTARREEVTEFFFAGDEVDVAVPPIGCGVSGAGRFTDFELRRTYGVVGPQPETGAELSFFVGVAEEEGGV